MSNSDPIYVNVDETDGEGGNCFVKEDAKLIEGDCVFRASIEN